MLEYGWKRLLSAFLALVLVAGMLPAPAFATETEPETQPAVVVEETTAESTAETESVPETMEAVTLPEETAPAESTEGTVPVESTEATEATVPETTEETTAETTEVTLPESVQMVQALINALPTEDTVTAEDYDAVQDAYDAYEALSDGEKALIQGAEVFESLFGWFNAQVETLETIASGTCGESLTWKLDSDGTLTISGTGDMEDYGWHGTPWYDRREEITSVVVAPGVTGVGEHSFADCTNLNRVTLPDGITRIGDYAFYGCKSLHDLTIPNSVTAIGCAAFRKCDSLPNLTIPEGVTTIGECAFQECNSMTSITIPGSVTCYQAIGYGATILTVTSPATAEFADAVVSSKTTAALRNALGEVGLTFDPETGRVTLKLAHPGLLTPGKSYTLLLDVTPQGNAENVKPTQVKLTVKVQK